jgi:hypothetical protein
MCQIMNERGGLSHSKTCEDNVIEVYHVNCMMGFSYDHAQLINEIFIHER